MLVTQGTVATDFDDLLMPTIRGLADEDVLVVATTGKRTLALDGAAGSANLRLERHVPFARLMPFVDVMVTNGGYGGVHFALAHGVPLVVAGQTEDKTEICARVALRRHTSSDGRAANNRLSSAQWSSEASTAKGVSVGESADQPAAR